MEKFSRREKFKQDIRPPWAVEVDKVLAERRIPKKKLAEDLGLSYSHVINILCGTTRLQNNTMRDKICGHLGIEVESCQ